MCTLVDPKGPLKYTSAKFLICHQIFSWQLKLHIFVENAYGMYAYGMYVYLWYVYHIRWIFSTEFFDEFFRWIFSTNIFWRNFSTNYFHETNFFAEFFLTIFFDNFFYLLIIASFRIRVPSILLKSDNFRMSLWKNCLSQNSNEKISKISALASKERSNQKLY